MFGEKRLNMKLNSTVLLNNKTDSETFYLIILLVMSPFSSMEIVLDIPSHTPQTRISFIRSKNKIKVSSLGDFFYYYFKIETLVF